MSIYKCLGIMGYQLYTESDPEPKYELLSSQ